MMKLIDWFRSKRTLVNRIHDLETGIRDIGTDLVEKRIMFMHKLTPEYVLFLETIILRMSDLLGEKGAE